MECYAPFRSIPFWVLVTAVVVNPHPLRTIQNFCEKNFYDWISNHEIHKDIVPRKFEVRQYVFMY